MSYCSVQLLICGFVDQDHAVMNGMFKYAVSCKVDGSYMVFLVHLLICPY